MHYDGQQIGKRLADVMNGESTQEQLLVLYNVTYAHNSAMRGSALIPADINSGE